MPGVPQDPKWHPEGDVWVHTLHCMDAFARERTGEGQRIDMSLLDSQVALMSYVASNFLVSGEPPESS